EKKITWIFPSFLHVEHFAYFLIVQNKHEFTVLTHRSLSHRHCTEIRTVPAHHYRYSPQAALQQVLLSRQNLSLTNRVSVVFEFEEHVLATKLLAQKSPECRHT